MINAEIRAKLVETFTQQVADQVRWQFNRLKGEFATQILGRVPRHSGAIVWRETVRPCCDFKPVGRLSSFDGEYTLSEEKLAMFSARTGEAFADEVVAKVNAKIGELEDGEAAWVHGGSFTITGTKNGKKVRIDQHQIVNCSVKGKLFNQYPSRIYVDGKFTSAAAFKKI
jgi:hypothetical protein